MAPERVIRVAEVAGAWHYFVPLHIWASPLVSTGRVTTLGDRGWHDNLSAKDNPVAYSAVQAIRALGGARVLDVIQFDDGTTRLNILVATTASEDVHMSILTILCDAFDLYDCNLQSPSV